MSTQPMMLTLASAEAMEQAAAGFVRGIRACVKECTKDSTGGLVIALRGPLGAGKTTWCRGLLRALGYPGVVKSPTYTLVESYRFEQPPLWVHHFDLYRLGDAEELEFIGGRDYFDASSVCLVEWPERAAGFMPVADIDIDISYQDHGRSLVVSAATETGDRLLSLLEQGCVNGDRAGN